MFEPLGFELLAQGELGIPEAPEPFHTFVENALAKARHAAALSGQFGVLILCVVTALALVVLTRRRLGYRRYHDEAEHLDIDAAAAPKGALA